MTTPAAILNSLNPSSQPERQLGSDRAHTTTNKSVKMSATIGSSHALILLHIALRLSLQNKRDSANFHCMCVVAISKYVFENIC